jgi:hypothetical protein
MLVMLRLRLEPVSPIKAALSPVDVDVALV